MTGIIGGVGSRSGIIGTTELDYETGTWTPEFNSSGGSETVSYHERYGYFTKTGNICFVIGWIRTSGIGGSGSGTARIGGLPFSQSTDTKSAGSGVFGQLGAFSTFPTYLVGGSGTYISLGDGGYGSALGWLAWGGLATGADSNQVQFSFWYKVA